MTDAAEELLVALACIRVRELYVLQRKLHLEHEKESIADQIRYLDKLIHKVNPCGKEGGG